MPTLSNADVAVATGPLRAGSNAPNLVTNDRFRYRFTIHTLPSDRFLFCWYYYCCSSLDLIHRSIDCVGSGRCGAGVGGERAGASCVQPRLPPAHRPAARGSSWRHRVLAHTLSSFGLVHSVRCTFSNDKSASLSACSNRSVRCFVPSASTCWEIDSV